MEYIQTSIKDVVILKPRVFEDKRGYFFESFRLDEFKERVASVTFVQENESYSVRGVLRGLHFQRGAYAQAKLVRAVEGRVLDVVVDLRPESPTFGRWISAELSAENMLQIYIPRGFAHGFIVLSQVAKIHYKCDNYYAPEAEDGIAWNDADLAINWTIDESKIILSVKDATRQSFKDYLKSISKL